jgi:glucosamine kinase
LSRAVTKFFRWSSLATAQFFLGVDGGATRCRARLRDSSGRELGYGVGPASNIYIDFDAAMRVVHETIDSAIVPGAARQEIAVGLSLAGLSEDKEAERVAAALPGFARVIAVNDAVAACVGANGLGDGGLIIAGTGSAGIARVGARTTIIGGRGFWLGDDGSAARLGEAALRATLRALDGLEPMSELARALARHFGDDPLRMTRWAAEAKPSDYGAFAPQILDVAKSGDARARELAGEAAKAIGALANALSALGTERIALVGGFGEPLRPYFPPDVARRLVLPHRDAVDGAILLAGGTLDGADGLRCP